MQMKRVTSAGCRHYIGLVLRPGVDRVVDLLLRWGASETALDSRGKTRPDNLQEIAAAVAVGAATQGNMREQRQREIQRALVVLARASADRTWRRRCWLAMLRARAGMEREERSSRSTSGSNRTEAAGRTLVGRDEDDGSNKVGK
ncbi:unnamed protein product, partial [Ectocarpus sp. 4 AP-2014]